LRPRMRLSPSSSKAWLNLTPIQTVQAVNLDKVVFPVPGA
jgi:hypothetical protein